MDSERFTLLQQIDAYLDAAPRRACDVERAGPFTLFFRRDTPMQELSYARPIYPPSAFGADEIAAVRTAFARRERVCRWEFLADLAPDLPAQLVAHGFPPPVLRPLMVVTPETFRPHSSPTALVRPVRRDETVAFGRVLAAAFGAADEDGDDEPDLTAAQMDRGATVLAAVVDSEMAGGGCHTPIGETTEVAGIGVAEHFRRRGLGGAITSALVADAFARGCSCVFLSAADEDVQRVYARIGFVKVGTAMDTADMCPARGCASTDVPACEL